MNTASGVSGHPEDTIHQGASNAGHAGGHDTAQAEVQPAKSAIIRGQSDQNEMDELNGHFSDATRIHSELPDQATMHPERHIRAVATAMKSHGPFLLVDVGSGVSFYKVSDGSTWERVGGTTLGGASLMGLVALLTKARSPEEMLELAEQGHNSKVDKLIGDIYGSDYMGIGLRKTAVAATFGNVFGILGRAEREGKTQPGVRSCSRTLISAGPCSWPFSTTLPCFPACSAKI
uniref:Pantothenate kinase n=1 Tax=Bionectria ochroleuca TaxID=29856 RepID=A0A8H7TU99_BIOOC